MTAALVGGPWRMMQLIHALTTPHAQRCMYVYASSSLRYGSVLPASTHVGTSMWQPLARGLLRQHGHVAAQVLARSIAATHTSALWAIARVLVAEAKRSRKHSPACLLVRHCPSSLRLALVHSDRSSPANG